MQNHHTHKINVATLCLSHTPTVHIKSTSHKMNSVARAHTHTHTRKINVVAARTHNTQQINAVVEAATTHTHTHAHAHTN